MAGRADFNSAYLPRTNKRALLMGKSNQHINYASVKELFINAHKSHKDSKRKMAKSKTRDSGSEE